MLFKYASQGANLRFAACFVAAGKILYLQNLKFIKIYKKLLFKLSLLCYNRFYEKFYYQTYYPVGVYRRVVRRAHLGD
jgi:hypothetical protein